MKKYVHLIDKANLFKTAMTSLLFVTVFIVGVLSGRLFEKITLANENPVNLECASCNDSFSVLNITEVTPLFVKGEISSGDLRLTAGDELISGSNIVFTLPTASIYSNIYSVIPDGTRYFASKKGKKLYSISNKKALERINPVNLIFFKTQEDAKRYGF